MGCANDRAHRSQHHDPQDQIVLWACAKTANSQSMNFEGNTMKTTLYKIRAHSPCADGWKKLLSHLDKTQADDEPLSIITILGSNGLDDALWCLRAVEGRDREIRLYAVWCARQVQHLMADPRSIAALDVAERYANGNATASELDAAKAAAWNAAGAAAGAAERVAATAAAWNAAWNAAWAATWAAAGVAANAAAEAAALTSERATQSAELRRVCAVTEKTP